MRLAALQCDSASASANNIWIYIFCAPHVDVLFIISSSVTDETDGDTDDYDSDSCQETTDELLHVKVPIEDIKMGKYRLVYAHPEAFLSCNVGMNILRSTIYRNNVACIAIDEAHMIQEW